LWLWEQSAYAAFLDHGDWTQAGLIQSLCINFPGVSQTMSLVLSMLTWILMVQGMMLPISIKAFERLDAAFRSHPWRRSVVGSFTAGYILFSILFGFALHSVGYGIGLFANSTGVFLFDGWIVGAAVFAAAGLFQFSAAKTHLTNRSCHLDCTDLLIEQPVPALLRTSLISGLQHGFFCFMCCWALMCLMFVFWTGSLIWMLCISTLMVIERRSSGLRRAVGALLILAANWVIVSHVLLT
jgi:predicted metal-binding membrane protein